MRDSCEVKSRTHKILIIFRSRIITQNVNYQFEGHRTYQFIFRVYHRKLKVDYQTDFFAIILLDISNLNVQVHKYLFPVNKILRDTKCNLKT